jgi:4'-phosphopantetheinyl transferase
MYAQAEGLSGVADTLGSTQPAIKRGEKGKPYFASAPGLHFSLSHSGDYCACAFHTRPVGLDLQAHVTCRREAIARRFFHPQECAYLESVGFEPFFQVWAAKESYLKYTGAGRTGGLGTFSVADAGGLLGAMDVGDGGLARTIAAQAGGQSRRVEFHHLPFRDDYSLCLCAESIPGARIERI